MLEYDIGVLNEYYTGKVKPIFIPARTKDKKLVYIPKNRKARRLLESNKFQSILKVYGLDFKSGYIEKKENING